jgi:hypothetical protein
VTASTPDPRYPPLFVVGDEMAKEAERRYLALSAVQLVTPLLCAALAIRGGSEAVAAIGAAFLVGLVVSLWLQTRRPDRTWFDGRALAESVKSLAWRYSMGVPPYAKGGNDAAVDQAFRTQYAALVRDIKIPASRLPHDGIGEAVTPPMRETRARPTAERKAEYIAQRLDDQRKWYRTRAGENERAARAWMTLISALQVGGLVLVGFTLAGSLTVNPFGLLAAMISSSAGWLQVRRHQELGDSYVAATVDLDLIAGTTATVNNEEDLQKLIEDGEDAMSREHTVWRAKRSLIK